MKILFYDQLPLRVKQKKLVIQYFILVPGLPDTGTPKGSCSKPEYTFRGTSCYKFIGSPAANWKDAETKCQADGAVLVTINDLYENAFVEANMGPNVDYWIGFKYNRVIEFKFE